MGEFQTLVMELKRDGAHRLVGTIRTEDQSEPTGFSGTLELLRMLEDALGEPEPGPAEMERT